MTDMEAIEILDGLATDGPVDQETRDAIAIAISALERRINMRKFKI